MSTNNNFIIWNDKTITYKKNDSIYTEKIVEETKDYFLVVGMGAGEELYRAGYAVTNRVQKQQINLKK